MKDDDYLYDRSGEEDPEVARLEGLLRGHRYAPGSFRPRAIAPRRAARRFVVAAALAAAAALVVFLAVRGERRPAGPLPVPSEQAHAVGSGPSLAVIEGKGATVGGAGVGEILPSLSWLESHDARVRLGFEVGTVDVAKEASVRVLVSEATRQHLELARGQLAVRVVAAPEAFVIDTPEARVVDLGCAYVLEYQPILRVGFVEVSSGFVRVERGARRVVVPRGATLRFGRDGIESPVEVDAPPALRRALVAFEQGAPDVGPILAAARAQDDHTLLDVAARTSGSTRAAVLARLVELVGLPGGVTATTPLEAASEPWRLHLRRLRLLRR